MQFSFVRFRRCIRVAHSLRPEQLRLVQEGAYMVV